MERSKSLSIKSIKWYKIIVSSLLSVAVLAYVIAMGLSGGVFGWIMALSYLAMGIFIWIPRQKEFIRKLKEISYDNKNLYVKEGDYEIQIPFHSVKDVEILSLDGLYKFHLYHHD